jgi:hypothetical protein
MMLHRMVHRRGTSHLILMVVLQAHVMIINDLAMLHVLLWVHFVTCLADNCYMPQLIDSIDLLYTIPVIGYTSVL